MARTNRPWRLDVNRAWERIPCVIIEVSASCSKKQGTTETERPRAATLAAVQPPVFVAVIEYDASLPQAYTATYTVPLARHASPAATVIVSVPVPADFLQCRVFDGRALALR